MNATLFDHAWIAAKIPHAGRMCLLDAVLAHDAQRIHCRAHSHRDANNPLRQSDRLGAACGVEYAAQAMAVHGAILMPSSGTPPVGYLASVRNMQLHVERLDTLDAPLDIHATRLSGNAMTILYAFEILAGDQQVLDGRAAVIVNPLSPRETISA